MQGVLKKRDQQWIEGSLEEIPGLLGRQNPIPRAGEVSWKRDLFHQTDTVRDQVGKLGR